MVNQSRLDRNIPWDRHLRIIGFLVAAGLLLWLAPSGLWDVQGPDEGRYVQVARELIGSHNWFLLTIHGEPYDQKPPLPFWMFAGMLKLTGGRVEAWAVRTPAILCAIMTLGLLYLIGRRLFSERAGLYAALVLMTSLRFFRDVPSAELNILFTGWTALAMAVWLIRDGTGKMPWGQAALFWLALAGGFFTKGPLILLIVFSAMGFEAVYSRNRAIVWVSRPLVFFPLLVAMIGGWLWIQSHLVDTGFVSEQVFEQTSERFFAGSHAEPFYYYLPRIFTGIFGPWGILLIPAGVRLWRARRHLSGPMAAILGWIIIPFIILTLAHGKRQTYMLPVVPAMALVVGWFLDRLVSEGRAWPRLGRFISDVQVAAGVAGIIFALLFFVFPRTFDNWGFNAHPLGIVIMVLCGAGMIGVGLWLKRRRSLPERPIHAMFAFMFLLGLINNFTINPGLNAKKSTRVFSQTLDALIQQYGLPERIGGIGDAAEPHYHVYGHYQVIPFNEDEFPDPPVKLPAILVYLRKNTEDIEGELALKDYHLDRETLVTGRDFVILLRNGLDSPKAPLRP